MRNNFNALLFSLHGSGRVVSVHNGGELIYELGGNQYHYYQVSEKSRHTGKSPGGADEVETNG
jgi:hypothetical protein